MAGSIIQGTIERSVTLGNYGYASPMTITASGKIEGSAPLAALYIPIVGKVANAGAIFGTPGTVHGRIGLSGGAGIDVTAGAKIITTGSIAGGEGATGAAGKNNTIQSGDGGIGVDLAAAGSVLVNRGGIIGGAGGSGFSGGQLNGEGGAGIYVGDGAKLVNSGNVTGGAGGIPAPGMFGGGGTPGRGVDIGAGGTVNNSGTITGGFNAVLSVTGTGVIDIGGKLVNSGLIQGEHGGVYITGAGATGVNTGVITAAYPTNNYGGYGLTIYDGAMFRNNGTVTGGVESGGATVENATLINHGLIQGGVNQPDSDQRIYTTGVVFDSGKLVNTGTIIGGPPTGQATPRSQYGIIGGFGVIAYRSFHNGGQITGGAGGFGGNGGAGVIISGGNVTNTGIISGGHGGTAYANNYYYPNEGGGGGVGFLGAKTAVIVTNEGTIIGGTGGYGGNYFAGFGGAGAGSPTIVNQGLIAGGTGGSGGNAPGSTTGTAGDGGLGASGLYIVNQGTIVGGDGGTGDIGGNGGVGVTISSGTLVNAGTIAGGAGGLGMTTSGTAGAAVDLGATSSLIVEGGASFVGSVAAAGTADTLELAGKSPAALAGIGTQFTGFTSIDFAGAAAWTLSGNAAGLASGAEITGFTAADAITLTDAAAGSGTVTVAAAGTVSIEAGGATYALDIAGATVGEDNFQFADYTLTETSGSEMKFVAPAHPGSAATENLAALFASPSRIEEFLPSAGSTPVTHAAAITPGAAADLLRPEQSPVLPAVTLHA